MREEFGGRSWHRLASKVLRQCLHLQRGQTVLIDTDTENLPVAELLADAGRGLGIHPFLFFPPDWSSLGNEGPKADQEAYRLTAADVAALRASHGCIVLPHSVDELRRRSGLAGVHRRALQEWTWSWNRLLIENSIPSVFFVAASATRANAKLWGVDFRDCQRQMIQASSLPARAIRASARPIADPLRRGVEVTITHPNGTHLTLGLMGCEPNIESGEVEPSKAGQGPMWTTVPGGFLAVALNDRVAEGRFVSNVPSPFQGRIIGGSDWGFHSGRLRQIRVGEGRSNFFQAYRHAGRERNRPAKLHIGLNPALRSIPDLADQQLGNITLSIGHNDDAGGRVHGTFRQYAVLRGATLSIDGKVILRAGRTL